MEALQLSLSGLPELAFVPCDLSIILGTSIDVLMFLYNHLCFLTEDFLEVILENEKPARSVVKVVFNQSHLYSIRKRRQKEHVTTNTSKS